MNLYGFWWSPAVEPGDCGGDDQHLRLKMKKNWLADFAARSYVQQVYYLLFLALLFNGFDGTIKKVVLKFDVHETEGGHTG